MRLWWVYNKKKTSSSAGPQQSLSKPFNCLLFEGDYRKEISYCYRKTSLISMEKKMHWGQWEEDGGMRIYTSF